MRGSKSDTPTTHHTWCCLVQKLLYNGLKVGEPLAYNQRTFILTTWTNAIHEAERGQIEPCTAGWHRPGPPHHNQRCAIVPTFKNGFDVRPSRRTILGPPSFHN
jgi:hypothetical protein